MLLKTVIIKDSYETPLGVTYDELCKCDLCKHEYFEMYELWDSHDVSKGYQYYKGNRQVGHADFETIEKLRTWCESCRNYMEKKQRRISISTARRKERRDTARALRPDPICKHCLQPFKALRSDAKYCSDTCRKSGERGRKKAVDNRIPTTVVHCMKEPFDVYIGRAVPRKNLESSKWANPVKMKNDSEEERTRVIEAYKEYFFSNLDLQQSVHELKGKVLGCWCNPKACHGDFLAELADKS